MEQPITTKNVGQPCVICGQAADAQATLAALQARVRELEAQSLKQAEEAAVMFAELTTLRGLVGALVYQLTDSGWTDLHGHTIEKNVAFIAARAALLQHRQGMEG